MKRRPVIRRVILDGDVFEQAHTRSILKLIVWRIDLFMREIVLRNSTGLSADVWTSLALDQVAAG